MKRNNVILSLIFILLFSFTVNADVWVGAKKSSHNKNNKANKAVAAGCGPGTGSTYLELNNVKTLIHTGGDMWWDLQGNPKYEVPKGSGHHANFASGIWIGGTDVNNQLRLSGVRYRSGGVDYFPGPLIASGDAIATTTSDICRRYDKHFVVSKREVQEFRQWYAAKTSGEDYDEDYTPPLSITEWPGNGPVDAGEYDLSLAPFRDLNGNGIYEPDLGEYPRFEFSDDQMPCGTTIEEMIPRLYGDQVLWWVYNDNGNVHQETNGQAIGMELRGQAFAFSSNDELNNMTFYNFQIINRSTYTLKNTYFAVFTDADIGDAMDDLTGCDVGRGLGFMYNADAEDGDGTGKTYGKYPPAIGVDFFEGPFMDPSDNHEDRPSAYIFDENGNRTNQIDMTAGPDVWYNGSINGLNFGDGIPDNERWGMRRFIYYNNSSGDNGDPDKAIDYYNYLRGKWKNNQSLKYGGNGFQGSGVTDINANFMYPGLSDITNWGTGGVEPAEKNWTGKNSDTPNDKRFVHSAGPFTLMPGAVNYITTGVVWARAYASDPYESVKLVIQADEKAQQLFERCFQTVDGPDAPELDIIEDDNRFIVNIWNKRGSNNYVEYPEDYEQEGMISCPDDDNSCDKVYRFEGYIVYQLKNKDVSINDISDPNQAKVVFQCDIQNDVASIINYEYNSELQATEPKLKVIAANQGLEHSFVIERDLFAEGTNQNLVNYKDYYYVAIAYAYNNYKTYDPTDPNALDGQKLPFLAGRNNIKKYKATPHPINVNEGGTELSTDYGHLLGVSQVDGYGTGGQFLEITKETEERILNSPTFKIDSIDYKPGYSPIMVQVTDPLNVVEDKFILKFNDINPVDDDGHTTMYDRNGYIPDSRWYVLPLSSYGIKGTDSNGVSVYGYDTIFASNTIKSNNSQLLMYGTKNYGLSVKIQQTKIPGKNRPTNNNGFIGAESEFSGTPWLTYMRDMDNGYNYAFNWIRSGRFRYSTNINPYDDYFGDGTWYDPDQAYESILNGAWSPFIMVAEDYFQKDDNAPGGWWIFSNGLMPSGTWKSTSGVGFDGKERYASVDIVFTKDKSKWTRCPVVEMSPNKYEPVYEAGTVKYVEYPNDYSIGHKYKFTLRASPSVNKNGEIDTINTAIDTLNPDNPNFMGNYGMGWFPGYVVDVETGERLNIMFGEDSHLSNENSQDMLWNPTSDIADDIFLSTGGQQGEVLLGGKHFIYIMGRNYSNIEENNTEYKSTGYDYGKSIFDILSTADNASNLKRKRIVKKVYSNALWVSIPLLRTGITTDANDPYSFIKSDYRVKIRMANPFSKNINSYMLYPDSEARNGNYPMYYFSSNGLAAKVNQTHVVETALDDINVVPNPYYAYNTYETSPIDHKVKITNLPNVCTIKIFNVGGTLVRTLKKDNNTPWVEWDLKNEYGITIAGGVYIIHINVPGVGEKVLKWFGTVRPIDLNNF